LPGYSLHWEPGEQPSAKQWAELERLVGNKNDVLLVWEDLPGEAVLQRLSGMKVQTVVIKPAANKSSKAWYQEQLGNIERLKVCCS